MSLTPSAFCWFHQIRWKSSRKDVNVRDESVKRHARARARAVYAFQISNSSDPSVSLVRLVTVLAVCQRETFPLKVETQVNIRDTLPQHDGIRRILVFSPFYDFIIIVYVAHAEKTRR